MIRDFRFRVQKVIINKSKQYQLRVGMDGERDLEFIPIHQSAYAQKIELKPAHPTREEAHRERDSFIEWLQNGALAS